MKRHAFGLIAVAFAIGSVDAAQAPQNAAPAPPALWTLSTDFALPESAYHDRASDAVFVSSINGEIVARDGNGYVSRLTPGGKMVNAKWVTGLNAPKGMRSVNGTLWVSDIDEVVAIDIASGKITSRVKVDGATFLNDLATAPDGAVYVSDSQGSRVYEIRNGASAVFVEDAATLQQPNGLLVDGGRLIVGTMGAAAPGAGRGRGAAGGGYLYAFDLKTKQRTQLTKEPVGGIDGIEPAGGGAYLVTDVFGSRIVHVAATGAVRTLLQLGAAGADFGYISTTRTAIVPYLFGNSVAAYDLTAALK